MNGGDGGVMVKICTCRDSAEAHLLVQELAALGYPAVVVGDRLEAALGELPASNLGPEVHAPAESADRVREVVERLRWRPGAAEPPAWTCEVCGERIEGRFTECWSCGGERGVAVIDEAGRAVMPELACAGCQYRLTNLLPAGRCPECGTRIIESIVAPGRVDDEDGEAGPRWLWPLLDEAGARAGLPRAAVWMTFLTHAREPQATRPLAERVMARARAWFGAEAPRVLRDWGLGGQEQVAAAMRAMAGSLVPPEDVALAARSAPFPPPVARFPRKLGAAVARCRPKLPPAIARWLKLVLLTAGVVVVAYLLTLYGLNRWAAW